MCFATSAIVQGKTTLDNADKEETGIALDPRKLLKDERCIATVQKKSGPKEVDLTLYFYECDRRGGRPALLRESAETVPEWACITAVVRGKYDMIDVPGPVMPHILDVLGDYCCGRRLEDALYRA